MVFFTKWVLRCASRDFLLGKLIEHVLQVFEEEPCGGFVIKKMFNEAKKNLLFAMFSFCCFLYCEIQKCAFHLHEFVAFLDR